TSTSCRWATSFSETATRRAPRSAKAAKRSLTMPGSALAWRSSKGGRGDGTRRPKGTRESSSDRSREAVCDRRAPHRNARRHARRAPPRPDGRSRPPLLECLRAKLGIELSGDRLLGIQGSLARGEGARLRVSRDLRRARYRVSAHRRQLGPVFHRRDARLGIGPLRLRSRRRPRHLLSQRTTALWTRGISPTAKRALSQRRRSLRRRDGGH